MHATRSCNVLAVPQPESVDRGVEGCLVHCTPRCRPSLRLAQSRRPRQGREERRSRRRLRPAEHLQARAQHVLAVPPSREACSGPERATHIHMNLHMNTKNPNNTFLHVFIMYSIIHPCRMHYRLNGRQRVDRCLHTFTHNC